MLGINTLLYVVCRILVAYPLQYSLPLFGDDSLKFVHLRALQKHE